MKQKFLSILSLMFGATALVQAQEATTYRGAFAPAPVRQWTENWTNWDPNSTVYGTANVIVSSAITTSTTWTANNVYQLNGIIYVNDGVTLTIEPGTVIRGNGGNSSLLVARGGKLIAEGTQCAPIVFTSNQPAGSRNRGDWGGVLVLGKARHNLGTANLIEGLANTDPRNFHGGTDDDDNSGVLKYVRIEFPGFIFSANNEINGLTLGSVGRGTVIDYVQVSFSNDDAFEWFGGSVNGKHLVAYKGLDDDWDTDNGFSGLVQYGLSIKDPNFSDVSQSEGFESDNNATGVAGLLPKTSAKFYNITQIGAFRCTSNADGSGVAPTALFLHRRGARVRRNSDLKIFNSIIMNNWRGLFVDDAVVAPNPTVPTSVNYNEDSAAFRNNIIAGDFSTTWTGTTYNGTRSLAYEDVVSRTIGTNLAYENDSLNTCSLLADAWNVNPALADFRPNANFVSNDPNYPSNPVDDPAQQSPGADLFPNIAIDGGSFNASQAQDFVVALGEAGGGATNGVITVTIPKLSGWVITVPGVTLSGTPQSGTSGTSNVFGGIPNSNGNWNFYDDGTNIIAVSKVGYVIPKFGEVIIGFTATRAAGTPSGTNQSLGVSVSGDAVISNNSNLFGFSAN